jgi:hypothetical protein
MHAKRMVPLLSHEVLAWIFSYADEDTLATVVRTNVVLHDIAASLLYEAVDNIYIFLMMFPMDAI